MSKIALRNSVRVSHERPAATFVDLIVGVILSVMLISLSLNHMQRQRGQSRSNECSNNLRNIGIAINHYHQAFKHLPPHGTGTHNEASAEPDTGDAGPDGVGGAGGGNNGKTLSMFVAILPFLGQQELWQQIVEPSSQTVSGKLRSGSQWNTMGPAPAQREYRPWVTDLDAYRCPSDPRKGVSVTGRTNYAACLGDAVDYQMESANRYNAEEGKWQPDPLVQKRIDAAARGSFVYRVSLQLADITDGLANTILVGEIATHLGDRDCRTMPALQCGDQDSGSPPRGGIFDSAAAAMEKIDPLRPSYWSTGKGDFGQAPKSTTRPDENRGLRWSDARTVFSGFTTIAPPNFSLQVEGDSVGGAAVAPPSSRHHGGVHLLMADGATIFITDSIECGFLHDGSVRLGMTGRQTPGSKSPYGLWGAMGTRASNDN